MRLVFNWTKCLCTRASERWVERWVFGAFICGTLSALSLQAQTVTGPPMVLKPSSLLQETITGDVRKELPTYLQSDRMSGETNLEFFLEGQTVIRRGDILLKADKLEYDQVLDLAKAKGNVYINAAGNIYQGPALDLQLDAFEGFFTEPEFFFQPQQNAWKSRAD